MLAVFAIRGSVYASETTLSCSILSSNFLAFGTYKSLTDPVLLVLLLKNLSFRAALWVRLADLVPDYTGSGTGGV